MKAENKTKTDEPQSRSTDGLGVIRRFFCMHKWKVISSDRCSVIRSDGTKEGEVTITIIECKCGASKLIPSDRTHTTNVKVRG